MGRLNGKVALVTGVSPNVIGGIAECMAQEGATIVAVDLKEEYAVGCSSYLAGGGHTAFGMQCDVTDEAAVKAVVARCTAMLGRIDVLINGAAVQVPKGVLETTIAEWRRQLDVILAGAFLLTREVARVMVSGTVKGSIINIISTEGHQGVPDNVGYSTAKGALLQFTRSAAMDVARFGIRVNSMTPTATDPAEARERAQRWGVTWEGLAGGQESQSRAPGQSWRPKERWRLVPLGRLPKPGDYGPAVVFLASDEAAMITGVDLRVDGGVVAKYWQWVPWPGSGTSVPAL